MPRAPATWTVADEAQPAACPAASPIWPWPPSRARCTAPSAAARSVSLSVPSAGKRAMPAETDTVRPSIGAQLRDAVEHPARDHGPGRARRDEHELVAAPAGDGVDQPDRLGEHGGDLTQDVVPRLVARLAVRLREIVDVEDRHGHGRALARRARDLELEHPGEGAGVGESRQRVAVRHPLEPFGPFRDHRPEARPVGGGGGEVGDGGQDRILVAALRIAGLPADRDDAARLVDPAAAGDERPERGPADRRHVHESLLRFRALRRGSRRAVRRSPRRRGRWSPPARGRRDRGPGARPRPHRPPAR